MENWKGSLENMDIINNEFWKSKRVFVTGNTGFKGSWLSLWLLQLGANVKGFSLEPPTEPSLFSLANLSQNISTDIGDIRNYEALFNSIKEFKPEIVIHMAAQPLVRDSYRIPVETYSINVMGTVHVLEAIRNVGSVRAVVNVTTDKCYENKEWLWGYRENEPMGGFDPYSNSKGCAELVTSAYRNSFFSNKDSNVALASARAGNVIGGGDWATDRLIPDSMRSLLANKVISIRNPSAIRPWQHVLEPLRGYLLLAQELYENGKKFADGWNFGPEDNDAKPVSWIVDRLCSKWGQGIYEINSSDQLHEARYLKLDCSKAKFELGWKPKLTLDSALDYIVDWYKAYKDDNDMQSFTLNQIDKYNNLRNNEEE